MKPRGPLMTEHRLIEKMIDLAKKEIEAMKATGIVDTVFIDQMVDFIKTYADYTHHGKEEHILFKELGYRNMDESDKRVMQELLDEHATARQIVGELVSARDKYGKGDRKSIAVIIDKLTFLSVFYPEHIKKEDVEFLPHSEKYFSNEEMDKMLLDFWEFDKQLIHTKYQMMYEGMLKRY